MRNSFGSCFFSLFAFCLLLALTSCKQKELKPSETEFNMPDGFEIEDVFDVGEAGFGSWVSLAEGPDNQFFACDQYGKIFTFQLPPIGERLRTEDIDSIDLNIGYAHGLLWAFNSLYVVVVKQPNKNRPLDPTSGVYRLSDTNGDGVFDDQKKLLDLDGPGEHGPHTMRVGPDGESLYLIAGNFNSVPDHFKSRLPRTWGEDNLFPPYLDARGHAVDLKAPGGWIARTDPAGKEWELVAAGMRNPFSFGFNQHGELFAYDADMEWDFGMPWYRPTRILHVTSGADFGWRTGSGKWPDYYPDNLPAVVNMAQGSPTAVITGKDLGFPKEYHRGLFACDWSFGTIYYVDLEPSGSTYVGKKREFMSGVPLPISNALAGSDGHLYFITGGRRLESHLYRIRYTGTEETEHENTENTFTENRRLRAIRQSLEEYHEPGHNEEVNDIYSYLNHEDRHIRYAARIALEHLPDETNSIRLWKGDEATGFLNSMLAKPRSGGKLTSDVLSRILALDWKRLSDEDQITLLRVMELYLIRGEMPNTRIRNQIIDYLNPYFPSDDPRLNRELSQLLIYLESHDAVTKCMEVLKQESRARTGANKDILSKEILKRSEEYGPQIADMIDHMPPTEAIHYVTILSHAKSGWTRALRIEYFEWFEKALSKKGGMSYKPFLDNIRHKALENVPTEEKEYFQEISGYFSPLEQMADLPQPVGPGKDYNLYDLGDIVLWGDAKLDDYSGTIEDGERAYQAALCSTCHRMKGEGGGSGPDLTNIHTRFDKNDLANSLLSPSEEISDQYAFTSFSLKNGDKVVGRVVREGDEHYTIYRSPFDITQTVDIAKTDVERKELSSISPMPAKLLNRLNEDEVKALFVYLLSGGDTKHEYYQ